MGGGARLRDVRKSISSRASFSAKWGRWPGGPDGVRKAGERSMKDCGDGRAIRAKVAAAGHTPSGASRHLPQRGLGKNGAQLSRCVNPVRGGVGRDEARAMKARVVINEMIMDSLTLRLERPLFGLLPAAGTFFRAACAEGGRAKNKNRPPVGCNPLKSPVSDERIQGNPNQSSPPKTA